MGGKVTGRGGGRREKERKNNTAMASDDEESVILLFRPPFFWLATQRFLNDSWNRVCGAGKPTARKTTQLSPCFGQSRKDSTLARVVKDTGCTALWVSPLPRCSQPWGESGPSSNLGAWFLFENTAGESASGPGVVHLPGWYQSEMEADKEKLA